MLSYLIAQRKSIRSMTMTRVLCDTMDDVDVIQPYIQLQPINKLWDFLFDTYVWETAYRLTFLYVVNYWPRWYMYCTTWCGKFVLIYWGFNKMSGIRCHDVIMTTMASPITSLTIVYWNVYSGADQRKHQSSASLAFVWGIHRDRRIPRTKGQLRGKCFHLMTSSCFRMHFDDNFVLTDIPFDLMITTTTGTRTISLLILMMMMMTMMMMITIILIIMIVTIMMMIMMMIFNNDDMIIIIIIIIVIVIIIIMVTITIKMWMYNAQFIQLMAGF